MALLHHLLNQQSPRAGLRSSPVHPSCDNRTSRVLLGAALSSVELPFYVNMQISKTSSHWFSSILQAPRSGKSPSESCWEERICFVGAVDVSWLITFDCFWLFLCTRVVSSCLFFLKLEQIWHISAVAVTLVSNLSQGLFTICFPLPAVCSHLLEWFH